MKSSGTHQKPTVAQRLKKLLAQQLNRSLAQHWQMVEPHRWAKVSNGNFPNRRPTHQKPTVAQQLKQTLKKSVIPTKKHWLHAKNSLSIDSRLIQHSSNYS